jgi:hypothetical protein
MGGQLMPNSPKGNRGPGEIGGRFLTARVLAWGRALPMGAAGTM